MTAAPRKPLGVAANRKRRPPSLTLKLAATLLHMVRPKADGIGFEPVIDPDEAKGMTAKQIIARFEFHHGILHAFDGPDKPWNITPMPKVKHRERTAQIDQPAVGKVRRLSAAQEEFRRTILTKRPGDKPTKPKRRWPSRPLRSKRRSA